MRKTIDKLQLTVDDNRIKFCRFVKGHVASVKCAFRGARGFTLVELVVVIGIIGVVSTVFIATINPLTQLQKGRDARRKSDVRLIQSALELYKSDNDSYPVTLPACSNPFAFGGVTYLQKVPCDPTSGSYVYTYTSGSTYRLCASIENPHDTDSLIAAGSCGSRSYVVTNP